jgi:hypothetical protein
LRSAAGAAVTISIGRGFANTKICKLIRTYIRGELAILKKLLAMFICFTALSSQAVAAHRTLTQIEMAQECGLILGTLRPQSFLVKEVEPKIFHLSFLSQREMTQTFLRFQEHYESPRFRGKVFSRNKFKEWYRTTQNGNFTYYKDWGGFNIPSYILDPFYRGEFKNLTGPEKLVLESFRGLEGPFYIIGSVEGKTSSLNHEISHGRFYINADYRAEILAILQQVDINPMRKWLLSIGYDESTVFDEVHAYLLNNWDRFPKSVDKEQFEVTRQELKGVEEKYYPASTIH